MKKLILFLMIAMLMLTGCKKEAQNPISIDEEYNIEGERVVLYYGDKKFPISFAVDGKQKIENGTYFYYDLNSQFGREWSDSFYLYHPDELELIDFKKMGTFEDRHVFATNGNWPLFLNPVHSEFSLSNQDRIDDSIITAGKELLKQNKMAAEPLIITDVWLCDMDKDGREEQFFKASNHSLSSKKLKEKSVTEDEISIYSFLGYLDESNCQLLYGSFRKIMNEPSNEEAASVLSTITYDKDGNLATSVLKRKNFNGIVHDIRPIIADPNGDGAWSVYVCREGDFNSITLMDFKDGSFIKSFEIIY